MPAVENIFFQLIHNFFLLNKRDLETVLHFQTYHSRDLTFCVTFLIKYFDTTLSGLFGSSLNALHLLWGYSLMVSDRAHLCEFHLAESAFYDFAI